MNSKHQRREQAGQVLARRPRQARREQGRAQVPDPDHLDEGGRRGAVVQRAVEHPRPVQARGRLHHQIAPCEVRPVDVRAREPLGEEGVRGAECTALLQAFFAARR